MSGNNGACAQCKAAKAKCEYGPSVLSCKRCINRQMICSGRSPGPVFQFRDENEVAQRNSTRARRRSKGAIVISTPLEYRDSFPSSEEAIEHEADPELRLQFPWLNAKGLASVSEPLKRDVETRAIERFFIDWTLYPFKHGGPGYFSELPRLYHNAPADCVLSHAVRAIAFADMRNTRNNDSFYVCKARQNYGAALSRMRKLAEDEMTKPDDGVLAGLLLIDNFELTYLARTEYLGLHEAAVRHVLRLRGDGQLHSQAGYHLWTLAHRRIQFKQMLTREEPDVDEMETMSKLNAEQPEVHFSADVLHMNLLVASIRKLIESPTDNGADVLEQADHLIRATQSLLDAIASWTSHLGEHWKPKKVPARQLFGPNEIAHGDFPSPPFLETVLEYQDIWYAATRNSHAASEIVLRESLIEIITYAEKLRSQDPTADYAHLIEGQKSAIESLSTDLIESMPTLLGFSEEPEDMEPFAIHQGRMVGRACTRYPSLVIQRARHTPRQHQDMAAQVIKWINTVHGLG